MFSISKNIFEETGVGLGSSKAILKEKNRVNSTWLDERNLNFVGSSEAITRKYRA